MNSQPTQTAPEDEIRETGASPAPPAPPSPSAPPADKQKRYRAARIAPAILCAAFTVVSVLDFRNSVLNGFGMAIVAYPLLFPLAIAALVFCFAPVAKWRVTRKYHLSYPIAIFCAVGFLISIVMSTVALTMGAETADTTDAIVQLVLAILFAGAEGICFAVQYHLGKKYPQLIEAESAKLKKLEEKYYFGGDGDVEM